MNEQDKQELLSRNHNIKRLASQMRDEIELIKDLTGYDCRDRQYRDVYFWINALSDRVDSLCESVDMGFLKGDNSKEETAKIENILNSGLWAFNIRLNY